MSLGGWDGEFCGWQVWRLAAGKRGALLHEAMVRHPGASFRRIAENRARRVQFGRFLRNSKVTVAEMARTAGLATGLRCQGRDIAVIQDTSEVALGAWAKEAGYGPVGKGGATRGFLVHAAIAVDSAGALLGLADMQIWTRQGGAKKQDRSRAFAQKESRRWLSSAEAVAERLAGARQITLVADAESDIYELYAGLPPGVHILSRMGHERRLMSGLLLSEALQNMAPAGLITRDIPAAPGRSKRTARLELRFGPVVLKAPADLPRKTTPQSLELYALEVREIEAPAKATPVQWTLLTSHRLETIERAAGILDLYRGRFLIEQMFRTLKTAGFDIEDASLAEPSAMLTFAGLATIAAVSILQLVKARDGGSGQLTEDCFDADDKPLLKALSRKLEGKTQKLKNPHPPDDLAFASWVIARLGGWDCYYGKPGPQTMRYGLERYHAIKLGVNIAKDV